MKSKKIITKTNKLKLPAMNCGGKKGGCFITIMPWFGKRKAA